MDNIRFPLKVKIPVGYPKWRGPHEEPTIRYWLENNYPRPEGMNSTDWLKSYFPKNESESDADWLTRLAGHPVWVHALDTWPALPCKVVKAHDGTNNRICGHIEDFNAMREHFELMGWFLDQRLRSLKEMGWVPPYVTEVGNRHVYSYLARNAVHGLFRALGLHSMVSLALPGEAFLHFNTVLPAAEAREASRITHDIYSPGLVGPWNVLVTSTKWKVPPGMAIACYHMDQEPITDTTTESTTRRLKWQYYQAVLYADTEPTGRVRFRGWMSPEKFVLMGAPPESADTSLKEYGFEQGYPPHFLKEGKRTVPCLGYQQDRHFSESGPRHTAKAVTYYYLPFPEAHNSLDLLRKLEGFDESRIRQHA